MRRKDACLLTTIVVFFVLFSQISISGYADAPPRLQLSGFFKTKRNTLNYHNHTLFSIDGNNDFLNQSSVEGWTGNGSISSPYIIENYNIYVVTQPAIHIANTNLHFIIQDCMISVEGNVDGIIFSNVSNGYISDNTVVIDPDNVYLISPNHGILLRESSNCSIVNNNLASRGIHIWDSNRISVYENTIKDVVGDTGPGIETYSSTHIYIKSNIIEYCGWGIYLKLSNDSAVTGNIVDNNRRTGIRISETDFTIISNNKIQNNGWNGLVIMDYSLNNTVLNNDIGKNGFTGKDYSSGIVLLSEGTYVKNNTIVNNFALGLYVSRYNIIEWNNFIGNSAYDIHSLSFTQPFYDYNYWDVWNGPDANNDGIVDIPYAIDAYYENNIDLHPLVLPVNPSSWRPRVLFPSGGEILSGVVEIDWAAMGGFSYSGLLYSVYFSSNGGLSWIVLTSDTYKTSYLWDTTGHPDWSNCLIKIVAKHPDGTFLAGVSSRFFTLLNDPQILEALEQGNKLGDQGTYEITMYLDNKPYAGSISVFLRSDPVIKTSFNTYYNSIEERYSDCNLTNPISGYVEITDWINYYTKTNDLIKRETTWSIYVSGYQQVTETMTFEYGNHQVVTDDASRYQVTYTQRYYVDGRLLETLQLEDIITFDRIQNVSTEAETIRCLSFKTENYQGVVEPTQYAGYTLAWIDTNGSLIQEVYYDETNSLTLSMVLINAKETNSSSSSGIPALPVIIVMVIILLIPLKKKNVM